MHHSPNHIPTGKRIWNSILAAFLLVYGLVGVIRNDLYIPGRRSRGVHLHGWPAGIMFLAMFCAVLVLLAVVVDHYDRRDNERHYEQFALIGQIAGWSCFVVALIVAFTTKA